MFFVISFQECNVDENGIFTEEAVCGLEGKPVLTEGNKAG